MLTQTALAVSHDETRYALNGVLFAFQGKDVRMVATDGHRLAMSTRRLGKAIPNATGIVPRKAVSEIMRVLGQMSARQPKRVADIAERGMGELANNLGGAEGFSQIPGYTRLVFVYFFAFLLLIMIYRLNPEGVAALRSWLDGVWSEALTGFQKIADSDITSAPDEREPDRSTDD